ncbi:ribonuclease H-like domain-containing protein [Halalkalibacter okhensis]|uniref:ribonuclease H-like domain-containing protein n=1 Tax=Halalkalibacter okhensis TaxID=333138 RepID=UPI00068E70D3|nr:ribonuclease H-like domain-containing protein [Halalkalibacter okhensis]
MKNKLQRMKQHMGMNNTKEEPPLIVPLAHLPGEKKHIPFESDWHLFQTTPSWFEDQYIMVRETQYPMEHKHGKYAFCQTKDAVNRWQDHIYSHPLSAKGRRVEELLFFDTETTGLSSGVGNTIFMLGYAQFKEDYVGVKQFFLPGPESEVALYHHFLTEVGTLGNLVTYNGKAFDWPQVKTRHTFVRDQVPKLPKFGHFDLLHASRRMWKDLLPSCKLAVVEKEVLAFERVEDTPSYMAPMLYFDFLQDPNPEFVKGIFQHHEWDVLSLLTLYSHLSSMILMWDSFSLNDKEKYEVARWYEAIGESEIAKGQYELLKGVGSTVAEASMFAFAMCLKKDKNWEEALVSFSSLVGTKRYTYLASIECSKIHEHHIKDFERAIYYSRLALADNEFVSTYPKEKQKRCAMTFS